MHTDSRNRKTWITFWVAFVALTAFNLGMMDTAATYGHPNHWAMVWGAMALAIGAFNALRPVWRLRPEASS